MPLTDSLEKPPAAGHGAGPIAAFSNSNARLPEHFFARLSPTPVAKPHLLRQGDRSSPHCFPLTAMTHMRGWKTSWA
jgi:hypothetical protein